jgi:hypothetical protein
MVAKICGLACTLMPEFCWGAVASCASGDLAPMKAPQNTASDNSHAKNQIAFATREILKPVLSPEFRPPGVAGFRI